MLVSLASDSRRAHADEQHGQQGFSECRSSFWAMLSRCANVLSWPVKVYVLRLTHLVLSLLDIKMFNVPGGGRLYQPELYFRKLFRLSFLYLWIKIETAHWIQLVNAGPGGRLSQAWQAVTRHPVLITNTTKRFFRLYESDTL